MLTKLAALLRPRRVGILRGTLQFGGLGCFSASAFTIAAAPLNITLGLAVTGAAAFVAEWLTHDA
ncbi:hypothetical protein ACIBCH_20640 [Amycolatopsis thailandensis]|uniref:hypothetical protein n=1 Tax=Amycolatopsis thailandensis TaxID=589330 RepID=UPI0037AC9E67